MDTQDSKSASSKPTESRSKLPVNYPLTHEEWLTAVKELRPRERDVLYYIRTLDPFGSKPMELGVRAIAKDIGCDASTVSRALKVLWDKGYIDLEMLQVRVKLKTKGLLFESQSFEPKVLSTDNGVVYRSRALPPDNKVDRETTLEQNLENAESHTPKALERDLKNQPHVPITNQTYLNKTNTGKTPTHHPVEDKQGGCLVQFLEALDQSGIRPNQNITKVVKQTLEKCGLPEGRTRLRNALTAVTEQMAEGTVTNPAGLFVSAVRRGFTANQAKRTAREREQARSETVPLTASAYQPMVDLRSAEMTIDQALMQGDRGFARAKLQALWDMGASRQELEELLQLRSDWRFEYRESGVWDGQPA
jgi:hypothetical protein